MALRGRPCPWFQTAVLPPLLPDHSPGPRWPRLPQTDTDRTRWRGLCAPRTPELSAGRAAEGPGQLFLSSLALPPPPLAQVGPGGQPGLLPSSPQAMSPHATVFSHVSNSVTQAKLSLPQAEERAREAWPRATPGLPPPLPSPPKATSRTHEKGCSWTGRHEEEELPFLSRSRGQTRRPPEPASTLLPRRLLRPQL